MHTVHSDGINLSVRETGIVPRANGPSDHKSAEDVHKRQIRFSIWISRVQAAMVGAHPLKEIPVFRTHVVANYIRISAQFGHQLSVEGGHIPNVN